MGILELHAAAKRRGGSYSQRVARWETLRAAAVELCARLPFRWESVAMDNPTQNHTGTTNGAYHIVLKENYSAGRLHRKTGQALCGGETVNLWNEDSAGSVTCKRCLQMAERHVDRAG